MVFGGTQAAVNCMGGSDVDPPVGGAEGVLRVEGCMLRLIREDGAGAQIEGVRRQVRPQIEARGQRRNEGAALRPPPSARAGYDVVVVDLVPLTPREETP